MKEWRPMTDSHCPAWKASGSATVITHEAVKATLGTNRGSSYICQVYPPNYNSIS
jgi:hypothetical protein